MHRDNGFRGGISCRPNDGILEGQGGNQEELDAIQGISSTDERGAITEVIKGVEEGIAMYVSMAG